MPETGESGTRSEMLRHPRQFRRATRTGRPVYLRRERRYGWRHALPLYVLWCARCSLHTVTHPAGYGRIHCRQCRRHEKVMTWARLRDKPVPAPYAVGITLALLALLYFVLTR